MQWYALAPEEKEEEPFNMSPVPLSNQYKLMSGKAVLSFNIKSKLGLFLPLKMCEILDLCTWINSAKVEADSP